MEKLTQFLGKLPKDELKDFLPILEEVNGKRIVEPTALFVLRASIGDIFFCGSKCRVDYI